MNCGLGLTFMFPGNMAHQRISSILRVLKIGGQIFVKFTRVWSATQDAKKNENYSNQVTFES